MKPSNPNRSSRVDECSIGHLRRRLADAERARDNAYRMLAGEERPDIFSAAAIDWQAAVVEALGTGYRTLYLRLQREVAHARYATVNAGFVDPALPAETLSGRTTTDLPVLAVESQIHQLVWTPGRPYLGRQHAFDPETGECFTAADAGVPAGRPPGPDATDWTLCDEHICSPFGPDSVWRLSHDGPPDYGVLLRQHPLTSGEPFQWWQYRLIPVKDLADQELTDALRWLAQPATAECLAALDEAREQPATPCPREAYTTDQAWLEDMPLYRALVAEAARREALAG